MTDQTAPEVTDIQAKREAKAAKNKVTDDPAEALVRQAEAEAAIEVEEADKAAEGQEELTTKQRNIEDLNPGEVTVDELTAAYGALQLQYGKLADYATKMRTELRELRETVKKKDNEIRTKQATIKNLSKRVTS